MMVRLVRLVVVADGWAAAADNGCGWGCYVGRRVNSSGKLIGLLRLGNVELELSNIWA